MERVDREVVVELGVPGASVGVSGFDGGSGMPIKVGVFILGGWMCRPVVGLVAFDMKLKVGGLMQELLT